MSITSPPLTSPLRARHIDLGDVREQLVGHRIYGLVTSATRLQRFMESHVFAVWDFQSLLKSMQQRLTCTAIPWLPTADREARRLVNEIVLDEESDLLPGGGSASHFELYLDGMRQAGANTRPIDTLLELLGDGVALSDALEASGAPAAAIAFVRESFSLIATGATHEIVAAFTYGREDVIPDMFRELVTSLAARDPAWAGFRWYLERHIEADDEKHGPICRRIVARLCGNDDSRWAQATAAARRAVVARLALWDALAETVGSA